MLPKLSEVEFNSLLEGPEYEEATAAYKKLCKAYHARIAKDVHTARETQSALSARLRRVHQHCGTAATRAAKQPSLDVRPLTRALSELDSLACTALAGIEDLSRSLRAIDESIPPQDRLLAPHLPHSKHYPELHKLLLDVRPRAPASRAHCSTAGESACACIQEGERGAAKQRLRQALR